MLCSTVGVPYAAIGDPAAALQDAAATDAATNAPRKNGYLAVDAALAASAVAPGPLTPNVCSVPL